MALQLHQWLDLAGALFQPGMRLDHDLAIVRQFRHTRLEFPVGLSLQWLGTAGFKLRYQDTTILIDPYFTRSSLRALALQVPLQPNEADVTTHVSACDAVLIGHTHFDHALDAPVVARRFGARVFGSSSMRKLMALYGLERQAIEVECGRPYVVGPFEITFVASLHSKLLLGLAVPSGGEFTCDHLDDLSAGRYRCGQTYGIHIRVAGVTFYHQGSCNLIDENVVHRDVDFFLAGIAGRSFTPRYFERILRKLTPSVVIPHHFDNFFRPVDAPLRFSLNVNMQRFVEEVHAVSSNIAIRTLDLLETIGEAASHVV